MSSTNLEKSDQGKEYGVAELVPNEARHYGFWDIVFTWIGANCQPSSWLVGGALAAAGFSVAMTANLFVNPISYVILALVGFMGFKYPTTSMGLTRVSFGTQGSRALAAIHVVTQFGWTMVPCYLGGLSLSNLFAILFGWDSSNKWIIALGVLIVGGLTSLLVGTGGSRYVRKAENIAVVFMLGLSVWIAVVVFTQFSFADIISWKPANGALSAGGGIDILFAWTMSWTMGVNEFTRYCKTRRAATVGPVIGASVGMIWFTGVGTVSVIGAAMVTGVFDPNAADPSSSAAALGLGVPALLVILLSVITTTMIAMYLTSASALNVVDDKVDARKMQKIIAVMGLFASFIPLLLDSFISFFYIFMNFLGMIYTPLTAILIVDFYLVRKKTYHIHEIFNREGPYWYTRGFNLYAFASLIVGVVIFEVFGRFAEGISPIGAVIPTLVATGLIYFVLSKFAEQRGYYRDLKAVPVKEIVMD